MIEIRIPPGARVDHGVLEGGAVVGLLVDQAVIRVGIADARRMARELMRGVNNADEMAEERRRLAALQCEQVAGTPAGRTEC